MENIFFDTNNQKTLKFLVRNNKEPKAASEIRSAMGISKGGLNIALRSLVGIGLVKKTERGNTYFYQARTEHPIIKQLKILSSTVSLYPLVKRTSPYVQRIVLFGSTSRGEDLPDSDIDLLLVTHNKEEVIKDLKKFANPSLKPIIKTPSELEDLKKKDPLFYSEIMRGITLFEKDERHEI